MKRTAIAIAVVEHDDRFLVGPRPSGKPLAGFWEFPGGRVEEGETPEQAAMRECREETGLGIEVVAEYPPHVHNYDHDRVQLHFFACRVVGPLQPPATPFRWVPRRALSELRFPKGNRELLARLLVAEQ